MCRIPTSARRSALTMSFLRIALILAICVSLGVSVGLERSLRELCSSGPGRDEYIGLVLDDLKSFLKSSEPFKMEDDIRQVMRLYNGELYGLHNFTLRDDPQINCGKENVTMVLLLAFNATKVHYRWNFAGIRQMTGGFWTFANRITTEVEVSAPLNYNKAVPFKVDRVRVTELDGLWVRVDGFQPFAWIASQIGNAGTMISRNTLKIFLQNNFRTIFEEVFGKYGV